MSDGKIAVRYAKALFEAAADQGILDRVRDDMAELLVIDKEVPSFRDLLESPVMNVDQKKKVFSLLFKGKFDDLSHRFILMTAENKREVFIPSMARVFNDYYKQHKGIKEARVSAAVVINKETALKFRKALEDFYKCSIELETAIKPELIGGFVLRVEDRQLDASVSSQLNKIKKELGQAVIS